MRRFFSFWLVTGLALLMNNLGSLQAEETIGYGLYCTPIHENLPFFDAERNYERWEPKVGKVLPTGSAAVTNSRPIPVKGVVDVRFSRSVYPAEDRSVDLVAWFDAERYTPQSHRLVVSLKVAGTQELNWRGISERLESHQNFITVQIPAELAGQTLAVSVELQNEEGVVIGGKLQEVRVAEPKTELIQVPARIRILGEAQVGVPVRVGVPLVRGLAWSGKTQYRLYDNAGNEVGCSVTELSHWSRLGSLKWIAVHFIATQGPYELEVTPLASSVSASENHWYRKGDKLLVEDVVRVAQSWSEGPDSAARLVTPEFLTGGFVEEARGVQFTGWRHDQAAPGNRYEVLPDTQWEVMEHDERRLYVRSEGWYVNPENGAKFCRYKAWLKIYRDSPCLDFEYQWIFTGDGNRDVIRNMGWKMPVTDVDGAGYVIQGEKEKLSAQIAGEYLLQYAPDAYEVIQLGKTVAEGKHSAGIARVTRQGQNIWMGVRDFWENYPAEIQAGEQGLTFFLWPQHGKERSHFTTIDNAYRLWFAHEGETLSFALPREFTEGLLYKRLSGPEPPFAYGQPETVNAQGIAKGTQLRFVVSGESSSLNPETILDDWNQRKELYADPEWISHCGVFPSMHPRREGVLESAEHDYALIAEWPDQLRRTFQVYGKWIYGDIPMVADVETGNVGIYRGYKKAHWGWPYSWIPFARSGEFSYRRYADIATRMMVDTAWCHYVSDELKAEFASFPPRMQWDYYQPFRAIGWNNEGVIPWAGGYWGPTTRMYCDKMDHLFDAWYLNGYEAGREVALEWMRQSKVEETEKFGRGPIISDPNRGRWIDNLLRQYLLVYEETADPWFIVGAHALAEMLLWREDNEGASSHFWQGGVAEYLRYTQDPAFEPYFLRYANTWMEPQNGNSWVNLAPAIEPAITAYEHTGQIWYLERATGFADLLGWVLWRKDEPQEYRNWNATGGTNEANLYYSWYLRWAPRLFTHLARQEAQFIKRRWIEGFFPYYSADGTHQIALLPPAEEQEVEVVLSYDAIPQEGIRIILKDASGNILEERVLDNRESRQRISYTGAQLPLTLQLVPAVVPEKSRGTTLRLPIAPHSTGEKVRLNSTSLQNVASKAVLWLKKQETESSVGNVRIHSRIAQRFPLRRASISDIDGQVHSDWQDLNRNITKSGLDAELSVPDSLTRFRLTTAAPLARIDLPEGLEPWFAVSRGKWFDTNNSGD